MFKKREAIERRQLLVLKERLKRLQNNIPPIMVVGKFGYIDQMLVLFEIVIL